MKTIDTSCDIGLAEERYCLMATGFTREELVALDQEMVANVPALPKERDKHAAPRVTAMRAAGTEKGAVFNLGFKGTKSLIVELNCVVAKEFAGAVNQAGMAYGWQRLNTVPAPSDHLSDPTIEDLPTAVRVTSLATKASPAGVLANFFMPDYGEAGTAMVFYFPRPMALEMMAYVVRAAQSANWWTQDYEFIPLHGLN